MRLKKVLLIASVILTLFIAVILIPALEGSCEDAARVRTVKDFEQLGLALAVLTLKQGRAPSTMEGLDSMVEAGLLERLPRDYLDQPYLYKTVSDSPMRFVIWSEGSLGEKVPIFAALFTWQGDAYAWSFIDSLQPYL